MDIKKLKEWELVKGTGKNQTIGVPYKKEKGYFIRWVKTPNAGQKEMIENYIENEPKPKKKPAPKKKK